MLWVVRDQVCCGGVSLSSWWWCEFKCVVGGVSFRVGGGGVSLSVLWMV